MNIEVDINPQYFQTRYEEAFSLNKAVSIVAGLFGKDAAERFANEMLSENKSKYETEIVFPCF